MLNKKQAVKMLLELISTLENIPAEDRNVDIEKFYEVAEVKALICLLKHLKVDDAYLRDKGFIVASLMIGNKL